MMDLDLKLVNKFVNSNINEFHTNKLNALKRIKLKRLLKKKNPYLFKAKNIISAPDLVKTLLDAFLSSQEETIFGDFLEKLAIFVCSKVHNGRKSSAEGIDIEFEKDKIKYIIAVKSGPNWGNSRQVSKMKDDFKRAKKVLHTSRSVMNIVAINGCCYGQDKKPNKGDYLKYCGQKFWTFISGNENLYLEIIKPLGYKAKERNEEFQTEYSRLITLFSVEFTKEYCTKGLINWEKLVKFNSSDDIK